MREKETERPLRAPTAVEYFGQLENTLRDLAAPGVIRGSDEIRAAQDRVRELAGSIRRATRFSQSARVNVANAFGSLAVADQQLALRVYRALLQGNHRNAAKTRRIIGHPKLG